MLLQTVALIVGMLLIGAGLSPSTASAAPGTLDPGFGVGGLTFTSIADGDAEANAVAATPDGGMVAAGSAVSGGSLGFAIARYGSSGTLDAAFGSDGVLSANLGHTTSAVNALAVETNGDILVAGSADTTSSATDVLLALYSPTGALVTSFGMGGHEQVAIGDGGDAEANAVVLDGSSALLTGRAVDGSGYVEFYESFNATTGAANGGTQYLGSFGNGTDTEANAITLDGGDVLLAGFTSTVNGYREALVTKLSPAGVLQTGFGAGGDSPLNDGMDVEASSIAVEPSGVIVLAGSAATSQGIDEAMVAGLNSSGSVDSNFGSAGVNALALGSGEDSAASALALDPSGDILMAGRAADSDGGQPARLPMVARFTSTGTLDTAFAPSSPTPGAEMLACNTDGAFNAGYVDASGDFVVAGNSGADTNHQSFLLARYGSGSTAGSGCASGSSPSGGGGETGPGGGGSGSSGGGSTASGGSTSGGGSTGTGGGGSTGTGGGSSGTTGTSGCAKTMQFGMLEINACFEPQGSRYLASGPVSIDGLSLEPSPCTKLLIDPVAETMQSVCNQGGDGELAISLPTSGGDVSGIPLYRGAIAWTIPTVSGGTLGDIDVGSFAELEGFPLIDQVDPVALSDGTLQLPLTASLPSPFDSVHGSATVETQLGQPVTLGELEVDVPEVWVGPLDVQNFAVDYDGDTDTWTGSAQASFADPLDYGVSAGAQFHNGSLSGLSAAVNFGTPGVPLGPDGLFLNELGFGVDTSPLTISGSLGVSYADILGLDGQITVEIPAGGWDIRIAGQLTVAGIGLADAYTEIDSDGNAFFGGGINWGDCSIVCVDADAEGWIDLSQGSFDAEASATAQVAGFTLGGGALNISSKSIAVCGSTSFGFVSFDLGAVYVYGSGISLLGGVDVVGLKLGNGGDCDVSGYVLAAPKPVIGASGGGGSDAGDPDSGDLRFSGGQLAQRRGSAVSTLTGDQLTVTPKLRGLVWRLQGSGTAPQITIDGPGGIALASSSTGAPVKTSDALILQDPQSHATYVVLAAPRAGKWTITPQNGTTITSISTARVLSPPKVTGHVSGTGLQRVLHYAAKPIPGQSLRFLEQQGRFQHVIATVTKDSGAIHFTPADGPTGRRTIVAQVLQGLSVRKVVKVASYLTPPLGPQLPTHLIARHTGSTLSVSWHDGGQTTLYLVDITSSTGATTVTQTQLTSATFRLPTSAGASVTVTPRNADAEQGPRASAKVTTPLGPTLRRPPVIHGSARVNDTVTCERGTWRHEPTHYVYEWLSDGVAIEGAVRTTYKLPSSQKGRTVTCSVTARNAAGYAVGTSAKVRVGAAAKAKTPVKKKGK